MSKFKTWAELEKELKFTPEEDAEMELEYEIIKTMIEVRQKAKLTQRELSEKSGIKQPSIAKIEKMTHSPQASTLIRLLYPMGYTLKVVPLKKEVWIKKIIILVN